MRNVLRMAMVGLILLAGCSGSQSGTTPALTPGMPAGGADQPLVLQTGKVPINWTQFNGPLTGFGPSYAVVVGPDKNMWFSNNQSGLLKVTMTGTMTPVPLVYVCSGTSNCNYNSGYGITVGADNKFYMTGTNYDYNHSKYVVGQATTTGTLKVFDIPSGDYGSNAGLLKGPDGNVWLLEQAHIGKITPGGTVTEFAYPSGATSNSGSLTVGADHNIWFTESSQNIVAKIVPASGKITEFALSTSGLSCSPTGIVSAPDGNLYFNCSYSELGQMTPTGTARQFYQAYGISSLPENLIVGADKNIWFADQNSVYIGKFNTTDYSFTNYVPPYATGTIYDLALGPDGNFWAPESDNKFDVYILNKLGVTPTTLSFTASGQKANLAVTEPGTTAWTATSVSSGVCGVAQGTTKNIFVVTANGSGTTKLTVKDAIGNSFVIPCKVK